MDFSCICADARLPSYVSSGSLNFYHHGLAVLPFFCPISSLFRSRHSFFGTPFVFFISFYSFFVAVTNGTDRIFQNFSYTKISFNDQCDVLHGASKCVPEY